MESVEKKACKLIHFDKKNFRLRVRNERSGLVALIKGTYAPGSKKITEASRDHWLCIDLPLATSEEVAIARSRNFG